jgi:hypothetical protein
MLLKDLESVVSVIKVHYMYIWKYHNKIPHFAQLKYAEKNILKIKCKVVLDCVPGSPLSGWLR